MTDVAGGKQALASSLVMIGSGLLGPALGPLMVGMVSDAATAAQLSNGLRWGMLLVPLASFVSGMTMLIPNSDSAEVLKSSSCAGAAGTASWSGFRADTAASAPVCVGRRMADTATRPRAASRLAASALGSR